jgi:hypothetical protein
MNKRVILLLIGFLLGSGSMHLYGQSIRDSVTLKPAPYAIGLQLGSTGYGFQFAKTLRSDSRLVGRVGVSYFAYDRVFQVKAGEGKLIITPDVVMGIALASVKWHPFKQNQLFVTAGAGYTWRPDVRAHVIAEGNVKFGGLQIAEGNVGVVNASLKWHNVLGYAGFGYGRSTPIRRLGFAVELGAYYLGSPKIDLQYTGFLETTTIDEQLPIIQNNLRSYRFLPSIQFLLTYGLFRK